MRALVTGGKNGFISSHLINALEADPNYDKVYSVSRKSIDNIPGNKVINVYADLVNEISSYNIFKTYEAKPDVIFHAAAGQGKDSRAYINNILMTLNLLNDAPRGCKFVYFSSSTVYGDLGEWHLCNENDITIPTNLYGAAKLNGESLVHSFALSKNIKPLIIRLCAIVGANATHGILPDLIRKADESQPGAALEVFGDQPGSHKPFLHISDCVSSILHLVETEAEGIYNISPADNISVEDIAGLVDPSKDLKWLGESSLPPGDNKVVQMDNTELLNTGWKPTYKTSSEALKQAILDIRGLNET